MVAYQYQRLQGEGVIRILPLEPSPCKEDQLCGTFLLVPLDQAPDFEALSFVWGEATSEGLFRIHEGDVKIRANLDAALRRLRQLDRPRLVWADAICIDQEDNLEKSSQVQMMADIYRKAKTTIAWFGPGDKEGHAETALCKRSTIADSAPMFGYNSPSEAPRSIRMVPIGGEDDLGDMKGEPRDVIAMATEARLDLICTNSWFKRLRITQEAVLSPNLVVYLGIHEVDWIVLEVAISLVYRAIRKIGVIVPWANEVQDVMDVFKEGKHRFLYRPPLGIGRGLGSLSGFSTSSIHHFTMIGPTNIPGPAQSPLMIMRDRPQRYLDTIWDLRYRLCADDRDRVYATRSLIP